MDIGIFMLDLTKSNQILVFKDFIKGKMIDQISQRIIKFDLFWFTEFDLEFFDYLLEAKDNTSYLETIEEQIVEIRKDNGIESPFLINFKVSQGIDYFYLSKISHFKENNIIKCHGYLDIGERYKESKFFINCPNCSNRYANPRYISKCKVCGKPLSDDNIHNLTQSFVSLEFNEYYENNKLNLSTPAIIEIKKAGSVINVDRLIAQQVDLVALLKFKQMGKIQKPYLKIIGINYLTSTILTKKRVNELRDFVQKKSGQILEILSEHIFKSHEGDDNNKKAIILTAIGLNKKDSNFDETKQLTMNYAETGIVGKGKSTLMLQLKKYMPIAGFVGKNQSPTSYDGGIVKNETGQYIYRAGELLRCNNGVMFVDEFGMLPIEIQNSLSSAMSEGKICITKILKREFDIFVNMIICGNPPEGEFNTEYKTLFENMSGTPQIKDRPDFIVISDKEVTDENKISKVYDKAGGWYDKKKEYTDDFIKELIFYIINYVPNPFINKEIYEEAKKMFMKLSIIEPNRDDGKNERVAVKRFRVRQWISFLKVIKCVGRIEGKTEIGFEDLKKAWNLLYELCYVKLLQDYGDIDYERFSLKEQAQLREKLKGKKTEKDMEDFIMMRLAQSITGKVMVDELAEEFEKWGLGLKMDMVISRMYMKKKFDVQGKDFIQKY